LKPKSYVELVFRRGIP